MKPLYRSYLLLVIGLVLSGCVPTGSTMMPIWTETQPSSPTFIIPTSTVTYQPTQAATLTPPDTLEPNQAKETLKTLLYEPVDCEAPCFWEIKPGQTTLGEAENIFANLRLQVKNTALDNKEFYGIAYDFDSGVSIIVTLTIQNQIVQNLRVDIHPEIRQVGVPRKWSAYSLETLINRYGPPSKAEFSVDRGPHDPGTSYIDYFMIMYFDKANMIVSYEYGFIDLQVGSLRACPLTDQFTLIRIWLGPNPEYPPHNEVSLKEATSMTMEQFSDLMTGNPDKACFNLKEEVFP